MNIVLAIHISSQIQKFEHQVKELVIVSISLKKLIESRRTNND